MKDESKAATAPNVTEQRGTLRIDAQPSGKQFQGVFLERADGSRWVIDYRARQVWTWFADREVIVTGGCYAPQGQAVMAPHFRVARLRPASPAPGSGPYLEVGPEVVLTGELVTEAAPPGSKLAGTPRVVFRADDGETYNLVGETPGSGDTVRLRGRRLEPDMTYAARAGGPDFWVASVHDAEYDPEPPPPLRPCP